jgi:uncharacterized lipoprotein
MKLGFGKILVAALLLSLAGCHSLRSSSCHNAQPYMNAKNAAPLEIPPGVDSPDTTNALRIPRLDAPQPPPRKAKEPCLDEPPSFNVTKPTPQA